MYVTAELVSAFGFIMVNMQDDKVPPLVGHPSTDAVKAIFEFTKGKKVDRIIEGDFGVNLEPLLDVVNVGGVIATYSSMTIKEPKIPFIRMMFLDLTLRMVLVYAMPEKAKKQASSDIVSALEGENRTTAFLKVTY